MKYSLGVLLFTFSICFGINAEAQKKELKKARNYFDAGEYYLCVDYYDQAKELGGVLGLEDKKNIARSYYRLNDITHAFEHFTALENDLSGDDIFLYASTLHQFELYDLAIEWYEKSKLQGANALHVNEMIASCKWALNNQNYVDYRVNPCFPLATQGQSFGVQYYKDKVVYSSAGDGSKNLDKNGHPFLNLYSSDLKDGEVVENSNKSFSKNLESPYHVGAIAFTDDFKCMYYTKSVIVGDADRMKIFVVEFNGTDWVNERELTINSNKYDCAHPAVTPDGRFLYFVSNRPDGYGGKDIYFAERKGPNSFGDVQNAGPTINTYADEVYPVISKDNKLYFSSNGHYGFGGLDIFVADFIDGKWQNVRNMMKPFNTNRDDFCYVIDPTDPNKGFLSSNKYGEGLADVIFYVYKITEDNSKKDLAQEMPPMIDDMLVFGEEIKEVAPQEVPVEEVAPHLFKSNIVSTYNAQKIEGATLVLTDASTGEQIATGTSDADGHIAFSFPGKYANDYTDYNISVTKDGFNDKTMVVSIAELDALAKEQIALTPIFNDSVLDDISGMSVLYTNDLDDKAKETLDKLATYLLSNPNIVVKLNAHTEARGNRYGNLEISQNMADKAKTYVVSKGVNDDQLLPRGYGERYLKNRCIRGKYCDKSQHAENRRIEVVVWNVRK